MGTDKFYSLTPIVLEGGEDEKIYDEALDFVFREDDIKNIAITGIYGAGKSTIWRTYERERDLKNVIMVSLGKYEDVTEKRYLQRKDIDKKRESDDIEHNRIERQIINQILSQIQSKNIPLSKYRFKENLSISELFLKVSMSISFVLSFVLWVLQEQLSIALSYICNDFHSNSIIYLSGVLFLTSLTFFVYSFYKYNKFKLSKINLKGAEANLKDDNDDDTVLNRDIKEMVYLLNSSKTEVVVFEDLDRYDSIEIFTKLRELNFLLNSFIQANGKKRIVKFIYMLKDGLFFSKDRTKFFDFIIPVVPIVDSKTSENHLVKLFKTIVDSDLIPNERTLFNISLYIDDMRLLKNIVNEYKIYITIIPIDEMDLNVNKLFALIVLKNVFPNEFDLLQNDKGYIRSVFGKLNCERSAIINKYKLELENVVKELEYIKNRFENDKFEAMSLMIGSHIKSCFNNDNTWAENLKMWSEDKQRKVNIIFQNNLSHYYNYDEFVSEFIETTDERKDIIKKMPIVKRETFNVLRNKKEKLEKNIERLPIYSFRELILAMSYKERDKVFLENNFQIIQNHYFPLIRYLISEGLLDETYEYYKGKFDIKNSETLKENDLLYLKGLLEGKEMNVLLPIESAGKIVNRLSESDFLRGNILNKEMLKYCIIEDLKSKVISIINSVTQNESYYSLYSVMVEYDYFIIEKLVEILLEEKNYLLEKLLNAYGITNDISDDEDFYIDDWESEVYGNILAIIFTRENISFDILKKYRAYMTNPELLMELISEEEFETFINNINACEIKFKELGGIISTNQLKLIEEAKVYELTVNNIIYITEQLVDTNITYGSLLDIIYKKEILRMTKEYVEDNFTDFIKEYIDGNKQESPYKNSEEIVLKILQSSITDDYKIKYLKLNETLITDILELKEISNHKEMLDILFEKNRILFKQENISTYWDIMGSYNDIFLRYMERNINEKNAKEILETNQQLCNELINDPDISGTLFEMLLNYFNEEIEEINNGIPIERICQLIERNSIAITEYNINYLVSLNYFSQLVLLVNTCNQDKEDEIISQILDKELNDELYYMLINSNISFENTQQLLKGLKEVLIEKINIEKEDIIREIINNYLTEKNVNYICNHFKSFKLKQEFIEFLEGNSELIELSNENLNEDVMDFIMKTEEVSVNSRVRLIVTKIQNNIEVNKLNKYFSSIEELSDFSRVWDGRQPEVDNNYKEVIAKALIDAGYVKEMYKYDKKRIVLSKIGKNE